MWNQNAVRRAMSAAAVAVLTLAACGDDLGPGEEEPEVATMRLTIGGTVVNFGPNSCTPTPAQVTILETGASVTAEFLRDDGTPDPLVTAAEFELSVSPANRFTRTSAFAGTLSGGAAGEAQIQFGLLHIEEQHNDFGPCSLTVIVP